MKRMLTALVLISSLAGCGGGGSASNSGQPPATVPPPAVPPPPPPPPPKSTVTVLHTFGPVANDGTQPNGPLFQASDGNFYGTTRWGGPKNCGVNQPYCGVIFKMTPAGVESVLYSFGTVPNDGFGATGSLVQGQDGALYGVTTSGGTYGGGGTAFRVTLDGSYAVLHSFGAPDEGYVPEGGLIQSDDGNFYGVTSNGGANHCSQIPVAGGNCGTVFKMTPSGDVTTLYSFGSSISDGVEPLGSLVQASDGNFYGTTTDGGANSCSTVGATNNCGTIFRMTPAGVVTIMHSFGTSRADGIAPQGSLIQAGDGALYGTTPSGGGGESCHAIFFCGTVFRMTLAGEVTIMHAFALTSVEGGDGPSPVLTLGAGGNIYGTTVSGGISTGASGGTVFTITLDGMKTTLHSFGRLDTDPGNPVGGVVRGSDGAFYGTTFYSGLYPTGTIFKLVPL